MRVRSHFAPLLYTEYLLEFKVAVKHMQVDEFLSWRFSTIAYWKRVIEYDPRPVLLSTS